MTTAKRVIKNTGFLYIKMAVTVFISFYTTRLILNSLGASDFGIFNIVGGAIAMLGFLNSTLANATQRFMSYAEGEGNLDQKRKIFNLSFLLHFIIAIVTIVLLLFAMYPLFNGILNILPERINAAKIVYLSLIFSTTLTIINVPYDAIMNAHENMLYYSLIGIFESILKLLVAFICVFTSHDKLVLYGLLMAIIPLVSLSIMKLYCHRNYEECIFAFRRYWDFSLIKKIASFSGWNFLTAISSLLSVQGVGVVLNHFWGATLNASQGIAQQLNGQLSAFSANLMKAVNPVIVKNAGAKDVSRMNEMSILSCKYSTILILLFAIPFIIEIKFILRIWLTNVPDWAELFCILQFLQTIIIQSANAIATSIYAQGDIKGYAIYKSIMNLLPLILTYVAFKCGGSPFWLYVPTIVVWGVGGNVVIIYYAKKKSNLCTNSYFKKAVIPICYCIALMLLISIPIKLFLVEGIFRTFVTLILCTIVLMFSLFVFGMNDTERESFKNILLNCIRYFTKKF